MTNVIRLLVGVSLLAEILVISLAYGGDLPSDAKVIYEGTYTVPTYTVILYRGADGYHWRRLVRKADGEIEAETRYGTLSSFRNELLNIDDKAVLMGSGLWKTDTDGDGYSDLLEYLTNGDPYSVGTVPTEPRILTFAGGADFVPLLPLPDMTEESDPTEIASSETDKEILRNVQVLCVYLHYFLSLLAHGVGLMLWRLAILSISRRNIL